MTPKPKARTYTLQPATIHAINVMAAGNGLSKPTIVDQAVAAMYARFNKRKGAKNGN